MHLLFHLTLPSFLLLHLALTQIYDPNQYTPGNNLLINPNFDQPVLGGVGFQSFIGGVPGWTGIP